MKKSYIGIRTENGPVLMEKAEYNKKGKIYEGFKKTKWMNESQGKTWLKQMAGGEKEREKREKSETAIDEALNNILQTLGELSARAVEIEKNAEKTEKHISHQLERMNQQADPVVRLVDGALSKSDETYMYSDISRILGTEQGKGAQVQTQVTDDSDIAVAYTDGSCYSNEGICGWGFVLVYSERLDSGISEERMEFSSGAGNVDQLARRGAQAGEFAAVEEAVRLAVKLGKKHVIIVHDRADVNPYAESGLSKTEFAKEYYSWIRSQPCAISFRKVKAHTTGELRNPLNAMADKLASGAAQDMAKKIAEMKQMF